MSKFTAPAVLALTLVSINANADSLGLYIGGGVWDHEPVGSFGTVGDSVIDVETDLGFSGETDSYFYAAFEHFVPLVPNLRIESASMGHAGTAGSFTFNGVAVSGNSSIDMDTTDTILYWRLLDNWVNLDWGINLRKLDSDFTIGTESVLVSETVPMLYLAAQFDMPFTGLSIGADVNRISLSDVSYQDVRFRALYEMGVIGFEAGIRSTTLELKNLDNVNADLEFKGVMLGAFLHF
ncbi:MAG: TIGR04219 family outer membrane beta-barrel protein [Gammaproteobacteria bacterium]|nr:TIGR04219 family outer membrane beta-barrel protein [Gammaproteobacteria bacterium]MCW8911138.1 TIGR04219 family outer membrane beta-barrel protein [Gammaproteobacteria bacterium]MCW9004661.1 TIGR04219 family outer membrane beta-barrel protein [Gammaproteobacteria bacterium]MCW9056988.1 TIGR04219 family outer membrane beta-barrel protein [Gammaproteobacteria bacterium]